MISRDEVRGIMPPSVTEQECEAYNAIREECMRRIQTYAADGKEFCSYVVPPFHFGLPVYEPQEVFHRLYAELNQAGYQLMGWPESRRFLISWYISEEAAVSNLQNAFNAKDGNDASSNLQGE